MKSTMTLQSTIALVLLTSACSGPAQPEPTTPSRDEPANLPVESMPAPGDAGGAVPDPPPAEATPGAEPGAPGAALPGRPSTSSIDNVATATADGNLGSGNTTHRSTVPRGPRTR